MEELIIMRLDLNIKTVEGRKRFLERAFAEEAPTNRDLEQAADYLIFAQETESRGPLLTANRMVTVNKRETSMEALTEKLEGGESAFHGLIKENKNTILTPKVEITQEDLDDIEPLRELRKIIDYWESKVDAMEGPERYKVRRMIIEMRKDQYAIKNAFRKPTYAKMASQSTTNYNLDSDTGYSLDGEWREISKNTIDLWNPKHVSQIIANYSFIKQETYDKMDSDLKWMLVDLERMIDKALIDEPLLKEILIMKIDKTPNVAIQVQLNQKFDVLHSQEYISSLYRNKIPKLIADKIKEEWVDFVYLNNLKGTYKTCTRCGETKLALNRYFSVNKTASGSWYSLCKECRNKKK